MTEQQVERHTVSLSAYEWHQLLSELEFCLRFANQDIVITQYLYEAIGSQLAGVPVRVVPKCSSAPKPMPQPELPKPQENIFSPTLLKRLKQWVNCNFHLKEG